MTCLLFVSYHWVYGTHEWTQARASHKHHNQPHERIWHDGRSCPPHRAAHDYPSELREEGSHLCMHSEARGRRWRCDKVHARTEPLVYQSYVFGRCGTSPAPGLPMGLLGGPLIVSRYSRNYAPQPASLQWRSSRDSTACDDVRTSRPDEWDYATRHPACDWRLHRERLLDLPEALFRREHQGRCGTQRDWVHDLFWTAGPYGL